MILTCLVPVSEKFATVIRRSAKRLYKASKKNKQVLSSSNVVLMGVTTSLNIELVSNDTDRIPSTAAFRGFRCLCVHVWLG